MKSQYILNRFKFVGNYLLKLSTSRAGLKSSFVPATQTESDLLIA
jgi:hypothetical protein